jgi:3-hydroxyisobutyrate dehydrogenase-like beta-hydroxyacid dehydrogenase
MDESEIQMTQKTQLGFIGLGQMGSPMAERLLRPDVELHVYDATPAAMASFSAAGAIAHRGPKDVADAATIVFSSLPSGKISEVVAFGPNGVAEGKAIKTYVEMSTIGADCITRIASELSKRNIVTVDSPISGGPPAAKTGRLAMMVSGEADAVSRVSHWLGIIGHKVYELGNRPGQAQTMKLINNLLMATNLVAASEGLTMGIKAGLDVSRMAEVIEASSGQSTSLGKILSPSALSGKFAFGAHLSIVAKDTALGTAEAGKMSLNIPVIQAANACWQAAIAAGMKDDDFTKMYALVLQDNGIKI